MLQCPYCEATERQIKGGRNRAGGQRFQCSECARHYTPEPRPNGYPDEVRVQTNRLSLEGTNFRRIGRILSVNHQSVANWVNAYHAQLPPTQKTVAEPETVELDELYSFVGSQKSPSTSPRPLIAPPAASSAGASSGTRLVTPSRITQLISSFCFLLP